MKVSFPPCCFALAALFLGAIQAFAQAPANYQWPKTYTNPLQLASPLGPAVSCPDPAIIKQRMAGSDTWYLYCTAIRSTRATSPRPASSTAISFCSSSLST